MNTAVKMSAATSSAALLVAPRTLTEPFRVRSILPKSASTLSPILDAWATQPTRTDRRGLICGDGPAATAATHLWQSGTRRRVVIKVAGPVKGAFDAAAK